LHANKRIRYQFNPQLSISNEDKITNILVKALTVFPSESFALCLSLLPPHVLQQSNTTKNSNPQAGDPALGVAIQRLSGLNNLLESADYTEFWSEFNGDDLFADLCADCAGFEDSIRLRVVVAVSQAWRKISRSTLESWLNLKGKDFEHFINTVAGFKIDGDSVIVPRNKENEAKSTVVSEKVTLERKWIFGSVKI
jgi:translation initiation factor 3 subunit K